MAKKSTKRKSAGSTQSKRQQQPGTARVNLDDLPVEQDPTVKTLWADRMDVVIRHDVPVAGLSFYASVANRSGPQKMNEACRVQVSLNHLEQMVDILCRVMNYYPTKPSKGQKEK